MKIKQAVLLCGGKGTRLRPYTETMSKQMIPILGHPITEWNIVQFRKHGVTEFLINLHTKPEVMRNYLGDGSKWGVKIIYNLEMTTPGVAGSIKLFEKHVDDEFFVVYGDTLSFLDYSKMEQVWGFRRAVAIGMQRTQKIEDYRDADVAELDTDGKFVAVHPKPHEGYYPNAHRMRGVFILKKRILSYIPSDRYYEIGGDLLPRIMRSGESFYSYQSDDYSKGIDTVDKWRSVEDYLREKRISFESLCQTPA